MAPTVPHRLPTFSPLNNNGMKWSTIIRSALLVMAAGLLFSCGKTSEDIPEPKTIVPVELELYAGNELTRSFQNDNTHHVNRILVIPFRKTAENLSDDDSHYVPAYTLAVQRDVTQFPVGSIVLHLPIQTTYKVLILGYSQSDYNYNDRTNPANRFDIGAVTTPVTLANFYLYPKSPTAVPEFFSCICTVYNGATLVGTTFRPEQNYTLSGNLTRLVSGFSINITDIPTYVKSISLVAENLTKASKATDASIVLSQTAGDGGNRLIEKKTPPSSGTLVFKEYLLPTFETNKTGFFLDVEYGTYTERYTVKVPDTAGASSGNKFIFAPNQAINVTGVYSSINLGFSLSNSINLDDNAWDGWQ